MKKKLTDLIKDIKLDPEQSLVDALIRFHKRRLEGQKKKLRAFSQPNARRNRKHVTRQLLNDTQSANHIVNHNDVNLSDLQKQILDLKNIVFSHVLMNSASKQDKQYHHSVFSDSTKAGHKTSMGISKNKRRKNRRNTPEKKAGSQRKGINEKFLRNFSTHQLSN